MYVSSLLKGNDKVAEYQRFFCLMAPHCKHLVKNVNENARGCPLFTSYYPFSLFLGGRQQRRLFWL